MCLKFKMKQFRKLAKSGFTLLEMLVVLLIVGLLMAIIIPNVSGQKDRINQQAAENIKEIVQTQRNTYLLVEDDQDVTLDELQAGGYLTDKQVKEAQKFLVIETTLGEDIPIQEDYQKS